MTKLKTVFLTGVSSFTGCWMAKGLLDAGYQVVGTFTRSGPEAYVGLEAERLRLVLDRIEPVWSAPFGSEAMRTALQETAPDILGLHAAKVGDHTAADFDVMGSARETLEGLPELLDDFQRLGGKGVIHTASYFEADTGTGDTPREAFSPYALCKGLTWQLVRFETIRRSLPLLRFVIPNPFGPLDKPGFTTYLLDTWSTGARAQVRTPEYVRDNIPVDRLALEYVGACDQMLATPPERWEWVEPAGFQEPQGVFARRFADEVRSRTGWACELEIPVQTDFRQPLSRTNRGTEISVDWDAGAFWDSLVQEALSRRGLDVG